MPAKIDNRHKEIGGKHRALSRYYMICNRVKNTGRKKNAKYSGVEVRISKDDFVAWFMPLDFHGCSVDRIDKNGHYELANMQVISLTENIAKDKVIAKDGYCRCFKCKRTMQISEFVKDKRRVTMGIATICRRCESDRTSTNHRIRKINEQIKEIHGGIYQGR